MKKVARYLGEQWPSLILLAAILAAFVLLRSSPTELGGVAEFDAILTDGRPAVVEFYSNY